MNDKILIIGSGTMGNGIAHVFAQAGYRVNLYDISSSSLEKALKTIGANLDRQVKKEIITESDKIATLNNITTSTDLQNSCKGIHLAIEAASENENVKKEIFKQLDQFCDIDTVLATNTSSISITKLAAATQRPEKVIGMHFMNPVPVMTLIEVIKGYKTDESTLNKVLTYGTSLNKTPVIVNDYPGFVANKILMPMINEAIYTLYEGIAGVKEIDSIMQLGASHPMGPLKLADFIGLDVCLSIMKVLHEGFGNPKYAPCPLLVNMVNAGQLGVKTKIGFYDWSIDPKTPPVSRQFV